MAGAAPPAWFALASGGHGSVWQSLGFLALLLLACEIGYYLHRRDLRREGVTIEIDNAGDVLVATLGLLALMIALTFSMAQGRFDARRTLLVAEANALTTTYLQTQLIGSPRNDELVGLLRDYADVRLSYFDTGNAPARVAAYDRRSHALRVEMWEAMLRATAPYRALPVVGLVAEPLAQLIDIQAERRSARLATVPVQVMTALVVYSLITAALLGYVMGSVKARHRVVALTLFVLITLSIHITLDLDNPTTGDIRLSPEPLVAARALLATPIATPAGGGR